MIAIVERFALSIEFHIKWKLRTTLYFMVVGTNVTLISSDNDYTIVLNCAILVQFEVGCFHFIIVFEIVVRLILAPPLRVRPSCTRMNSCTSVMMTVLLSMREVSMPQLLISRIAACLGVNTDFIVRLGLGFV